MSILNSYADNINKSTETKLYTGVGELHIHAVNPSPEELKDLIGDGYNKFDTTYAPSKDYNQIDCKPLTLWCSHDGENLFVQTINLYDVEEVASTGNKRIINNKAQYTWATDPQAVASNEKMGWFSQDGIRVAKVNEVLYYKMLSQMIKWNHDLDLTFYEFCKQEGFTYENVYNGNVGKLQDLIVEAYNKELAAYALFIVKENEDTSKVKQTFITRPDYFFRNAGGSAKVEKMYNSAVQNGKSITKHYFTFKLEQFNKANCIGQAPEAVANTMNKWG